MTFCRSTFDSIFLQSQLLFRSALERRVVHEFLWTGAQATDSAWVVTGVFFMFFLFSHKKYILSFRS
jgi:hypothetical protein